MKQRIALSLCLLLLFSCMGCRQDPGADVDSAHFYYPRAQLSFDSGSSAFEAEYRHMDQWSSWAQVLNIYLAGPTSNQLRSPFPAGIKVINTTMENGTVTINVSRELAQLSGLELTIACGCLTLTCLELTGAETIIIRADGALLDGQKSIRMNKNTLMLLDITEGE